MRLASLAWRGLTTRRLRASLTIIGVALGVALVSGTLLAGQAASEAVERAAREILGKAELRVRAFEAGGFDPRTVQRMRQVSGVTAAAPVAERRMQVTDPIRTAYNLLVLGVDPDDEALVRTYDLEAGSSLSSRPTDAL
jgi:ABC-type antimicrobial peptide transport system permease subunit